MSQPKFNYYADQLAKLKPSEYPQSVKFWDGLGSNTNQIDLNLESIPELIKHLKTIEKQLKKASK